MSTPPLEPPTVDDRLIWDIWLSRHIHSAVMAADELGIFSLVHRGPASAERIRHSLALQEQPLEAVLAVLAALGLVRQFEGQFQLTDTARTYLVRDEPFYWGYMMNRDLPSVSELVNVCRHGNSAAYERVRQRWETGQITADDAANMCRAMHSHSFPAALGLARKIDLAGIRHILDVGGGAGSYSIALAQQHPDLRCSVADLPVVCERATYYIGHFGMQQQVDTYGLNMFSELWPGGYDAVFLSNVLHDWEPTACAEILKRAYEALPEGGRILIHEMLLDDGKDGPLTAALFSLLMTLGTRGKQFTLDDLRRMLAYAGFGEPEVQVTYGYYSLVTARKV